MLTGKGVSTGRVGLFGSGRGDWFGCPSGVLDCLGPALLTGKGCLLSLLDYLGPAAETSFGPFRHCMDHGGILDPSLGHEGGVRLDLIWAK